MALEGAAERWMVTLHNANASRAAQLQPFHDDAENHIKTIRQGHRPVANYTEEFWNLACCLNRRHPSKLFQGQPE